MGCSNKTITNLSSDFRQIDLLDKNKDVVKTYYQSFNDQIYEWINISCEFTKKKFKNIKKLVELGYPIMGHIGFTPQNKKKFKPQGLKKKEEKKLIKPLGLLTEKQIIGLTFLK